MVAGVQINNVPVNFLLDSQPLHPVAVYKLDKPHIGWLALKLIRKMGDKNDTAVYLIRYVTATTVTQLGPLSTRRILQVGTLKRDV